MCPCNKGLGNVWPHKWDGCFTDQEALGDLQQRICGCEGAPAPGELAHLWTSWAAILYTMTFVLYKHTPLLNHWNTVNATLKWWRLVETYMSTLKWCEDKIANPSYQHRLLPERWNWAEFSFAQLLPRVIWYPYYCFLKSKNIFPQITYFSAREHSCIYERSWLLQ